MKEDKLKIIQENYGWVVALITGTFFVTTIVLKLIKYIQNEFYFAYYGISFEFFNTNELSILYDFWFSILLTLFLISILYCMAQIINRKKMNIKKSTIAFNTIVILIYNIIITCLISDFNSILYFLINFLIIVLLELIVLFIMKGITKKIDEQESIKNYLCNYLKLLPLYLILLTFCCVISYGIKAVNIESYAIIDNNKAIVYTTNDYYITLDCEIEGNKLILHKGAQTKIGNNNIESKLIKFDEVKIK